MRTVLCHEFGPAESLRLEEVSDPVAGPGEVLVRVHAAGLNFPDVLMIQGKYQSQPPMPFSPGGEFAGVIEAVGAEVREWQVGDRVMGGSGHGAFSELLAIDARRLRRVPATMDLSTAASFSTTYGTSWYALKQRANLRAGETLLVTGAAGGVGLAAVELGKAVGARVIAAASTDEKRQAALDAGADEAIGYDDLKGTMKELTNGKGADVIYDPVGGELFDSLMRSIGWYGRVLVIGFAAGDIPKLPINLVLLKSCQVVGVFYGAWSGRFPEENSENFDEMFQMHADGKLKPLIGARFPLDQYAEALNTLSERRALGKVVLEIPGT